VVERERSLQDTLVTTQRLVEEMKMAAKREADLIVREAELRGDKAVEAARSEEAKLRVEIQALRRLRRQAAEEVASTLDRYQRLLHAEAEDDPAEPS
jgi:cell division initiation protein